MSPPVKGHNIWGFTLRYIFLDFETFYSQDYTLKKMTPVEYVLDPRFECIGCGIQEGLNGKPYWLSGPELHKFFAKLDPNDTALVSHNALFDMCVVAWIYDFVPRLMVDTLGLCRATIASQLRSLSLAKVAEHFELGVKGGTVHKVVGMSAEAIKQAGIWDEYVAYCLNDVELCVGIFKKLVIDGKFPPAELALMDMVLRCAIEPQLLIDGHKLAEHLGSVRAKKEALLARVGVAKEELMSNEKFAEALRRLGIDPPMKTSLATGKETYAFSRTDQEFMALEEHEDPEVQALFAARLGYKSTLEETRTERFLNISRLEWRYRKGNWMPVPLRYSGAHTHRLSGDWGLNLQNMPRGGALRSALIAPPGHKVLACDASQIEARIVAWLCGQHDLVAQFANKEDVYSSFASKVFGFEVNKKQHPVQRFIGKTAVLGLGYGLGWQKFKRTIELQSAAQTGTKIELTDEEAQNIVKTYRESYEQIPKVWRMLNNNIPVLATGAGAFSIGPCNFIKGAIELPSGLKLHYHDLRNENDGWMYYFAGKPKRMYGGAILENIVQSLARIVVMNAALRVRDRLATYDVQLALQVHDELVYVVPDDLVNVAKQIVLEEMQRRPDWADALPLDAEADCGQSYGDAK